MNVLISILISIFITSCANVRSISQTSIPAKKGKVVKAEVKKNIFFFFNFNNDYVDNLSKQLVSQCPKGSVKGILTKDVVVTYFPIIYRQERMTAEGYCNE